ncbi:hypothetical protein AOQ84DRAFT_210784 [Glonium stellatum]|uniref:Secreted protein n=1 Tax=Glonium stellatum TaxID=574774 RepID=A0A8E2F5I7_9PEZI|nr:hypothetical protein AOQ84DRAFT_210784 [Glonium stellatum]
MPGRLTLHLLYAAHARFIVFRLTVRCYKAFADCRWPFIEPDCRTRACLVWKQKRQHCSVLCCGYGRCIRRRNVDKGRYRSGFDEDTRSRRDV